jgi:aspartate beta-hydroxylase
MSGSPQDSNQPMASPHPGTEPLLRQAIELNRAGRLEESHRVWEQILALDPDHADALYHLGHRLLQIGRTEEAKSYFERALVRAAGAPLVHLALAQTANKLGKAGDELAAINRVLGLDPYFTNALLAKGAFYEKQGKLRMAGANYRNALKTLRPGSEIHPQLRATIEHAAKVVDDQRRALDGYLSGAVREIRDASVPSELERYDECQAVFTGIKTAYVQNPLLLHFPSLPVIQFYDRALFPWIEKFESHTAAVREELQHAMRTQDLGWAPYIDHPDGAPLNQWSELQRSSRWSSLFLWKDGRPIEEALAKFPAAAAALAEVPLNAVPGRGPTVFFSSLAPKTKIPPHTGSTNARLVLHLPLIVPGGCALRVGNDTREFVEGRAWVFDDTIEHEAWNNSDAQRVVLLMDIWNPFLTQTERDLVGALMSANERYYAEEQ